MPNKLYIFIVSSIFFTISDIFFSISCIFPKISCMYLLDVLDILQQVFLSETARHTFSGEFQLGGLGRNTLARCKFEQVTCR